MTQLIPIETLLDVLSVGEVPGRIREARPGEQEDFVQERDKDCTGVTGCKDGRPYNMTFPEPVRLLAGRRYVVELEAS